MSRRSRIAALGLASLLCLGLPAPSDGRQDAGRARVIELQINGEIEPVLAEYVDEGIARANQEGAALVLITIDTPGGLDTAMRDIIQHMLDSRVPVAVYVSPRGARAASAGFFILQAADIAAMAPGTHTGAASPLLAVGGYPITIDETLKNKILNDATAYLRSYAGRRGRNVELGEKAITEAKAFTEREALDGKLSDVIANSRAELLRSLDGRTITRFDGTTTRLALPSPDIVSVGMSARQRFLTRIVEPDMFFILLLVGVLGLYVEFTHPGMIAPGVIGAIALVLALYAMQILPINLAGVLLIVLALGLFILEAKYVSHGVLGTGGVIAMLLGALMLVRSPLTGAGVSVGVALGATLPFALLTILLMRLVLRSRSWKPLAGVENWIGDVGRVTEAIRGPAPDEANTGMVFVNGELWRAASDAAIPEGTRVRVVRVAGLTLYVEPEGITKQSS
ncbi:MAG TPA: nodulation protein NfeD [Vicinamibacterales bacterium]|nr:nodulation protein NfeD [Vicinamibacterales bacterium]